MKNALTMLVILGTTQIAFADPLEYRFDQVKRSVMLRSGGQETAAAAGAAARGGDQVETGWFSSAVIASETQRAKFEIFSSTEVTLAEDTPGVILSLERGRIRAVFDKIIGSEPRLVKTPGALLAVRGTQFDVRVDGQGRTTVDVFEGLVEVRSPHRPEPLLVNPGEEARITRDRPPTSGPMPEHRRREAPGARDGQPRDPDQKGQGQSAPRDPNHGGRRGDGPTDGGRGPQPGGGGSQPAPPPPPPPSRPPFACESL
jgi:hypothetical protein